MSQRVEFVPVQHPGPEVEFTMHVAKRVEAGVLRNARERGWWGAAALAALLTSMLPGLALAAPPYAVEIEEEVALHPLPIDPEAPVGFPRFEGPGVDGPVEVPFYGSYGIDFPFPVTFFGETYDQGAVGEGILTFGPRSETLCAVQQPAVGPACANGNHTSAGPIPREIFPNRLLAVWWKAGGCVVKTQGWGAAPERTFVVELGGCSAGFSTTTFDAQIWFREGDSAIEVVYGEVRDFDDTYETFSQVGLMSPVEGGGVEGYAGLSCAMPGSSCRWSDFPMNSRLTYRIPADLAVDSVETPSAGLPGLPLQVRARVRNLGDALASGATVRFHLSERSGLGAGSQILGELEGTFDLLPGEEREVELEATLPNDLAAGPYYVIAQVDPYGAVPRDLNQENNVRSSPVILIGVKAPALVAAEIEAPAAAAQGTPFLVRWRVENQGSAEAEEVPFGIYLSDDEEITLLDRRLATGSFSVAAFDEGEGTLEITLPASVAAGRYFLGLLLDPDDIFPPSFKIRRSLRSEAILVDGGALRVLTTQLPDAELGKPYCLNLEAAGGDGIYEWSLLDGSELPAGLALEELPEGAKEAGRAFATRLCGRPSRVGTFAFELKVRSDEEVAAQAFELAVHKDMLALAIATFELPFGTYLDRYEVALRGRGGRAPYRWALIGGGLPAGISLRSDGLLVGAPETDGTFHFDVLLTDAAGNRAAGSLQLLVSSPSRLTCGTRALPTRAMGEPFDVALNAAGGIKPLGWRSVETRRIATAAGERSERLGSEPPPGLSLSSSGQVGGNATEIGRFLWTVQVTDSAPMPAEDHCFIVVDVPMDRGLVVATRALALAPIGDPYAATLEAMGGEGSLRWRILEGGRLPEGFTLSPAGVIEGIPTGALLDGERARTFPFLAEVRDSKNRRGVAPLSITVIDPSEEELPQLDEAPQILKTSGSCSAGSTGTGLLAAAACALWMLRRRGPAAEEGTR